MSIRSPSTTGGWCGALAGVPAEVLVSVYPLAPELTVDDVTPLLIDVVEEVRRDDLPLTLMGDSAGGALVLVLARRLSDLGRPAPEPLVAGGPGSATRPTRASAPGTST